MTLVCECFEQGTAESAGQLKLDLLTTCFDFSAVNTRKLVEELVRKEIDTTNIGDKSYYEIGYEFGQKLALDLQKPMVQNCDSYFNFFREMKKEMIVNLKKGTNKKTTDSLKTLFKKDDWSPDVMWKIGAYQLHIGKLSRAEKSFKKCLSKDPKHLQSNFFLALVYEQKGDYSSAISSYNQVIAQPDNSMIAIANMFLEVALRESMEEE